MPQSNPMSEAQFKAFMKEALQERAARKARQDAAGELLKTAQIIAVNQAPHDTFLMLHPSTVIPSGWQVSKFDRRGPFGHVEHAEQDQAIAEALEDYDLEHGMRPVTEAEFMEITATDEFRRGVDAVTFNTLDNRLRYEFGYTDEVMAICKAAREAADYDEAIAILRAGLAQLRGS